ncbi:hypothetical protein [Peribacillus cavernae]|uniref:hypothetical protein n=1 Tax=Peribacillus cavernae TaxID=1674310 RepID=UPI00163C5CB0|nr:hypothetical protein [Peribacillus cavernae]MDQ0221266.1 threonyl-tRNA synthetase [Peribacillus cavernae]
MKKEEKVWKKKDETTSEQIEKSGVDDIQNEQPKNFYNKIKAQINRTYGRNPGKKYGY